MLIKNQNNHTNTFGQLLSDKLKEMAFKKDFEIVQLCDALGMSRSSLHRKIKALSNLSTAIYIRNFRLQKAKKLLLKTSLPISQIAANVGFSDLAYFSKCFKGFFGVSPSNIRKEVRNK